MTVSLNKRAEKGLIVLLLKVAAIFLTLAQ